MNEDINVLSQKEYSNKIEAFIGVRRSSKESLTKSKQTNHKPNNGND